MIEGIMDGEVIYFDKLPTAHTNSLYFGGPSVTITTEYDDFIFLSKSLKFQEYFEKTETKNFVLKTKKMLITFQNGIIHKATIWDNNGDKIEYSLTISHMHVVFKTQNILKYL
jgi:hypothetical protein